MRIDEASLIYCGHKTTNPDMKSDSMLVQVSSLLVLWITDMYNRLIIISIFCFVLEEKEPQRHTAPVVQSILPLALLHVSQRSAQFLSLMKSMYRSLLLLPSLLGHFRRSKTHTRHP